MILICDATGSNNELLHRIHTQIKYSKILNIISGHTDFFSQLAYCGLCIEQHVLDNNTIIANSEYRAVVILLGTANDSMDNLHQYLRAIRTDELIFPSRSPLHECSWVAGHLQSVIKLAACATTLCDFTWPSTVTIGWGNPFIANASYSNKLMHLATRIQLKVGSLTP